MVILYGVTHSLTEEKLFGLFLRTIAVEPSAEFLGHLSRYPRGTKVGIEWLPEEEWEEVNRDLVRRYLDSITPLAIGLPYYEREITDYWKKIKDFCQQKEYEIVHLEDKETFRRLNEAQISLARQRTIYGHFPRREEAEDLEYYREMLECQEAYHRAEIIAKKIHQLERDGKLLEGIKANAVDVAIVGIGHSECWMADQQGNPGRYADLSVSSYCTDAALQPNHSYQTTFTEQAQPNRQFLGDRTGLEHAVRLLERGRISERVPDYVGVWNPIRPSEGYFEMMIEKEENETVSGTIEDCLGTAAFKGEITSSGCRFVKRYQLAAEIAARGDIWYEGERQGDEFIGSHLVGGVMPGSFYLKKAAGARPVELSLRWYEMKL